MHTIQITHSDIPITYNEHENRWEFTLRGRDRVADSLAKAKEFIDKPVPKEKAKSFEKIPAWFFRYSGLPKKIEVTGVSSESGYSGDQEVWITDKGQRSKESVRFSIYPQSLQNDALVETFLQKAQMVEQLKKEMDGLKSKLSPLVLPKDE